jgi:hypothetical protein
MLVGFFDLLVDLTNRLWVVSGNITWYGEGLEAPIVLGFFKMKKQ